MRAISFLRRSVPVAVCTLGLAAVSHGAVAADNDKKPSLSVKAQPMVGFSPIRVILVAEIRGGPDDYQDFYCASAEWDYGDGTRSEATLDCDPYEPGVSEIKRRYVVDRIFHSSGNYRIQFRLKQKNRVVGLARTNVTIRPGVREGLR